MESIYKWRENLEKYSKVVIFLSLTLLFILIFSFSFAIFTLFENDFNVALLFSLATTSIIYTLIVVPATIYAYRNPDKIVSLVLKSIDSDPNNPLHKKAINSFEKMKLAFGYKNVKLKIVDWDVINAFVISKKDESIVYVTKGALEKLDEHELDAVMAHEFSHIVNKDSYYLTLSIIVGGLITIISYVILRTFLHSVRAQYRSRRSRRGDGNILVLVAVLVALILSVVAPVIQKYLISKFSKTREYLADINAVMVTKYPPAMINVLTKVARENTEISLSDKDIPKTFALFLFDYESFETHPPVWERILRISQTTRTSIDPKFLEEIKNIEKIEAKKLSEIRFLTTIKTIIEIVIAVSVITFLFVFPKLNYLNYSITMSLFFYAALILIVWIIIDYSISEKLKKT